MYPYLNTLDYSTMDTPEGSLGWGGMGFADPDDCESDSVAMAIGVGQFQFHLQTAEHDFNKEKKTLFATHIWSGSRLLSAHIIEAIGAERIAGSSVIEFGAGAGLPSLLCAR